MRKFFPFAPAWTVVWLAVSGGVHAAPVSILDSNPTLQSAYAARKLGAALTALGHELRTAPSTHGHLVVLRVAPAEIGAEGFTIAPQGMTITVTGGDARGLIYGTLALREQLMNGTPIGKVAPARATPALAFRGIKFNTPWDTYRSSSALDQHYATARDLKFWEAFLDMMAENRFNAISLWTLHPFTYMIRPRNFPEASKWSDGEFAEWQHLYREIFRMAKERGLDTYVVFWSIFVSEEFSKAHDVARENFYPHYYVPGDTSDITKRYLRESVTQLLEEYPDLDGIGVSHGEGMGGMTPLQRQQFVDEVYIAGALNAKRAQPVKLIHRVPFSSGLSSGPGVSTDVEQVTRTAMEKLGNKFAGPIWVEMKFNWSHGHSTPKLVKVHGGALGDTYFKPPPSNYKIVWQVRNEDFFALRWGVPDFIRQHIAQNGGQDYVGGYFVGSETYIPALDYFTSTDRPVRWKWAFERQWLFYKLWGRLLYDAQTPDSVFQSEFTRRYGNPARNLLRAYGRASSTQLRLASLYDSRWDFTLYGEGMLALQGEHTSYIGVDALIKQPTMDPAYVSVADFVTSLRDGSSFTADRMTPPRLIELLERDNREALRLIDRIDTTRDASLMYEVADIRIWANLGLHLAEKLRGAVALQTFRGSGDEQQRQAAIEHLQKARGFWDEVIRITRPIYKDMKLTHYNGNSFDANPDNLFHWARIRAEVAQDVEVARRSRRETVTAP
ncbi:MAG: glycoside hydrolase family 20 zincin-like fold domain-containing protein [Pseudomonadota bacterium]